MFLTLKFLNQYQDFLSSGGGDKNLQSDGPCLIITSDKSNPSPLAEAIYKTNKEKTDIYIQPEDEIPSTMPSFGTKDEERTSFPIYVCLPDKELSDAISKHLFDNWEDKRDDLVFITSNGNIEPTLKKFGLPRDATSQLLVSFTCPGGDFQPMDNSVNLGLDSQFQEKFAGESVSCGKWKDAIAARLDANEIRCRPLFMRDFKRNMWEKCTFDAVFNLIGASAGDDVTLKEVAEFYGDDASEMAWQISSMLRGSMAIALSYGFEERMFEYATRKGAKTLCKIDPETWDFINGVFLEISLLGLSKGFGDPAPLHTEYVAYCVQDKGLLKGKEINIPETTIEQRESIMRKGNLRADGVI